MRPQFSNAHVNHFLDITRDSVYQLAILCAMP